MKSEFQLSRNLTLLYSDYPVFIQKRFAECWENLVNVNINQVLTSRSTDQYKDLEAESGLEIYKVL